MATRTSTDIIVTCDNPTCPGYKPADGGPAELQWNIDKAKEDIHEVPDNAFRLITLGSFTSDKLRVFCSWFCVKEAMRDYAAPQSPREKMAQDLANAETAAKQAAKDAGVATEDDIAAIVGGSRPQENDGA